MKTPFLYIYITFLILLTPAVSAQYIQVNDTYTAQQLVEDVLINSSCASVSNFSVSGGNFGNGRQSYGYFSGTGTSFPFGNGIVLSTGRANGAAGPNTSLLDDGGGMPWGGDPDLEQALGINNSVNATVLEFDFVPLGNKISFDYMLSSEEYHDNAPCQYSDGFAFLLRPTGSTGNYQNLAVVPNTATPVKVTSVRPQIGGNNGCNAQNPDYFGGFNGSNHPTNFNGQTVVLTAEATVTPGISYHIKLVIADEANYRYDSAIFLGGGSFEITTDLGRDRLLSEGTALCDGEQPVLDATNANAVNYEWYHGSSLVASGPAANTYTVPSGAAGNYKVIVYLPGTCTSEGEITLEFAPSFTVGNHTFLQCDDDNDGLTTYDLNLAGDLATAGDPNLTPFYYRTLPDANATTNAIATLSPFENTVPNQDIYVRVQNQYGCFAISTITLSTSNNTVNDPAPLAACDSNGDGTEVFNLASRTPDIVAGLPPGLQVRYYTDYTDALLFRNHVTNAGSFTNTTLGGQTVYARIYNGSECYGIAELELVVNNFGNALDPEEVILCDNDTNITLDAGAGYQSYTWNTTPPQYSRLLTVEDPGVYTVTVTNQLGCPGTKTFTVNPSGTATGADVFVNDFAGNDNSVTLTPQGTGKYEYSIDGVTYQADPVFTGLSAGDYMFFIRDINGCGPIYRDTFYIMDYPRFFTPNGDGKNDVWHVPYLQFQPHAQVTLFDRYGKLIVRFSGTGSWDGTYNGIHLPSTDYWFILTLENGRIIRGHFAMLR